MKTKQDKKQNKKQNQENETKKETAFNLALFRLKWLQISLGSQFSKNRLDI